MNSFVYSLCEGMFSFLQILRDGIEGSYPFIFLTLKLLLDDESKHEFLYPAPEHDKLVGKIISFNSFVSSSTPLLLKSLECFHFI